MTPTSPFTRPATLLACWLGIVGGLPAGFVVADIAYTNLGANDAFNSGNSVLIGRFNDDVPNVHYASRFTAEASGFVSRVELAVSLSNAGNNDALQVTLWDTVNNLPGSPIWIGEIQPRFVAELNSATRTSAQAELVAGTSYWVSARARDATGRYLWYRNSTFARNWFTSDGAGGTDWSTPFVFDQPAYRVRVSQIPEPGGLVALAVGCLFAVGRRRDRIRVPDRRHRR